MLINGQEKGVLAGLKSFGIAAFFGILLLLSGCVPNQHLLQSMVSNAVTPAGLAAGLAGARAGQTATQQVVARPSDGAGTVIKTANIRHGPGTRHAKFMVLTPGSQVKLLAKEGNWYQLETINNGRSVQGWIYASLISVNIPPPSGDLVVSSLSTTEDNSVNVQAGQAKIIYMGYSKDMLPVRKLLNQGKIDELSKYFGEKDSDDRQALKELWTQDDEFLGFVERGTFSLGQNQLKQAIEKFSAAERILDDRKSGSFLGSLFTQGTNTMGEIIGQGALASYQAEGYENVLNLNYLSIAFLLQGDRKAYNVARRSIDQQSLEKEAFQNRIDAAKKIQGESDDSSNSEESSDISVLDAQTGIGKVFAGIAGRAKLVPSAFVNPFGYYVTGMIQEYDGYNDRSLRDNARIAYEKALELNPNSVVLKQAVKDLKKARAPENKRLVHVVVAEGSAPEKKVLLYGIPMLTGIIPLKLPIYIPVKSEVGRIEVQNSRGRRLAKLSPVADIEALSMRNQQDMEIIRNFHVALAFTSNVFEKQFWSSLGPIGNYANTYRDQYRTPDTRSWMTLPSNIRAARIYLSRGVKRLKLASYSKTGRLLARRDINLNPNDHAFVYGRSLNKSLYVHNTNTLWLN